MYFYFADGGSGHIQSLLAGVALAVIATLFMTVGIVCDIIAANRVMLEDIRYRQLRQEIGDSAGRQKSDPRSK